MIRISKSEKEALEKAGLIKYRNTTKDGSEISPPNIYVANREHMSRSKTYYVVEEPKIMRFLGLAVGQTKRNSQGRGKFAKRLTNKNYRVAKNERNN